MAINIKFTKFDNTPWGFRLAGGSDFPQPLTVIRVLEGSLAECMGLKVGDVVVRLNDQPISSLTHGQAHEELVRAGNNFVLAVQRGEDSLKAVEALSEENIVPYKIPLTDLPPVYPAQILTEEISIERHEDINCEAKPRVEEEEVKTEVEPLPDKPKDANSEIVPNQNLTDDEIAQLILEEEELLNDKGVLGVNFKKLRPRVTALKQSKVIEELQNIATEEPPLVEQLRRTSVFLQKPQRPIPVPRKKKEEEEESEVESYKVVIKKQKKRSVTDRLLEKGLLKPGDTSTPEPPTPEVNVESNQMDVQKDETDSTIISSEVFDDESRLEDSNDSTSIPARSLQPPFNPESKTEIFECRTTFNIEPEDRAIGLEDSNESTSIPTRSLQSSFYPEPETEIFESQTTFDIESEDRAIEMPCVEAAQLLSKPKESMAYSRQVISKRKLKRYYTRGYYFRRCLFGGKGYVKKTAETSHQVRPFQSSVRTAKRGEEFPRRYCRTKGHYLETYLKREDNWLRNLMDGLFKKPDTFTSSLSFNKLISKREVSLRRIHYGEKILLRSVQFFAARLRSDISRFVKDEAYFGGDIKSVESKFRIGKRLYLKGRYFRSIFWRNVDSLTNRMKDMLSIKDMDKTERRRRSSTLMKTKGHYLERYLLENVFFDLHDLRARFSPRNRVISTKRRFFRRSRYAERILKKHFESLALIIRYVREQITQRFSSDSSSNLCEDMAPISPTGEENIVSNFIRSSKELVLTEIFHRGSRRFSKSSKCGNVSDPSRYCLFDWLNILKSSKDPAKGSITSKKIVQENDRDGRRLSFVPTILYEGITNRIGIDFTRLVIYAFVPCTSLILLYLYK